MYCSHCGTQLPQGASFCSSCGRPSGQPLPGSTLNAPPLPQASFPSLPGVPAPPPFGNAVADAPPANYAGFWLRVVGYIIDSIVLSIPLVFVGVILGLVIIAGNGNLDEDNAALTAVSYLIGIPSWWLYSALLESSPWQGTLGKRALGLRVTDEEGQRIGFGTATARHFAKYLSAIALCIGFLMVAFTDRKQGLHDRLARTLVLK
jgi:uncharacterized RDD family membrane protein YckC